VRDGKLLIEKPDKGVLVYRSPRIENGDLVFDGVGQTNKKWGTQYTYGGKLAENVTQAVARDVMADAMVRIEAVRKVIPVMTVHDELVYEMEAGTALPHVLHGDICQGPAWGAGLPIAAKLHVGFRYGK
jgi:DNA polymerase